MDFEGARETILTSRRGSWNLKDISLIDYKGAPNTKAVINSDTFDIKLE